MRRTLCLLTCALLAVGCGRYLRDDTRLGDSTPDHSVDAGTGGSNTGTGGSNAGTGGSTTGSTGSAGASASAGGAQSGVAGSEDAGSAGLGGDPVELVISPTSLPAARLNVAYFMQFVASGGAPNYAFGLASGALPEGVSLTEEGSLTGTPRAVGTFSFVIEATDTAGVSARVSLQLVVSRSRWLASQTFISTASSQSLLSLIDLAHPQAAPVLLVDGHSGVAEGFSTDGRWLLYELARGEEADLYLVDIAGEQPSLPQFVLSTRARTIRRSTWTLPCQWAPDSSRLACLKDSGSGAPSAVVYFDTSHAVLGPEVPVGAGERELTFLNRDTLVYGSGDDFARVEWIGQQLSAPQLLGVGGGYIVRQSPDGGRALVNRNLPGVVESLALLDFEQGQAQALGLPASDTGARFSLSSAFDAAFLVEPVPAEGAAFGFYDYYAVDGIHLKQVGRRPVDAVLQLVYERTAGARLARTNGSQVFLDTVANASVAEQLVPGDYQSEPRQVIRLELDPGAAWIYISTAQLDDQSHPIEATAEHWLSRVTASGAEPARLVGQGYLIQGDATSVEFSPDGRHLLLHGYNGYPHQDVPAAFRLFDLSEPNQIKSQTLDLPLSWANVAWSADSSYASIIGGDVVAHSRPLLVVDALAPQEKPRQLVTCTTNPAAAPGCPGVATFQP